MAGCTNCGRAAAQGCQCFVVSGNPNVVVAGDGSVDNPYTISVTGDCDCNGVESVIDNGDGTMTVTLDNGDQTVITLPVGPQGPQGDVGPVGAEGAQGEPGEQGPPGEDGAPGAQGEPGDPGPAGVRGSLWFVGIGAPTPETVPADANDMYLDSATGDYYAFDGTDWVLQGNLEGPAGPTGEQGLQGPAGEQGPAGDPGPAGEQGPEGDPGPAGEQGPEGDAGPAGAPGADGADGVGVASAAGNADGTFTLTLTDGTVIGPLPIVAYAVASGTGTTPVAQPGTTEQITVTFPAGRFTAPPAVTVNPRTSVVTTRGINAQQVTTTSFVATWGVGSSSSASSVTFDWIAVYDPSTALQARVGQEEVLTEAVVTCPTPGCWNEGIAIVIALSWTDAETGQTYTTDVVHCGGCGRDITASMDETS